MDNFWVGAWLALADFKNDNRSRGGSSGGSGSNSGSRRRGGYDSNQARGENGRWVETSSSSNDEPLFDPNSAIGRAHAREEQAKRAKQQIVEARTKPLPKGVEVTELGRGGFLYTHETKEGNSLSVEIMPTGDGNSKKVDFFINDSYDKDDTLSTKERNSISIKLAKSCSMTPLKEKMESVMKHEHILMTMKNMAQYVLTPTRKLQTLAVL